MELSNTHNTSHTSIPMEQEIYENIYKRSDENEMDEDPKATNSETSLVSSENFDEAEFLHTNKLLWEKVENKTITKIELNRLVKAITTSGAIVTNNNFKIYKCVIRTICEAKDLDTFKELFSKADLELSLINKVVKILITKLAPKLFEDWFDVICDQFKRLNDRDFNGRMPKVLAVAKKSNNTNAIFRLYKEIYLDSPENFDEAKLLDTYNSLWGKFVAKAITGIELNRRIKATETSKAIITDNNFEKYYCVIKLICVAKDLETFKELLSKAQLKKEFIIIIICFLLSHLPKPLFNDWFDVIVNQFKRLNIKFRDIRGIMFEYKDLESWSDNDTSLKNLFKAGAFRGLETEYLIDKMEPEVLEEILDSFITTNGHLSKAEEYEIYFDYRIFVQPAEDVHANEMTSIMRIVNSDELLPLLKHPLIASLLTLKWLSIARIFYLNFILYCFYGLSMVACIIFKCEEFDSNSLSVGLSWYLTFLGIAYLIIREIIQLIRHPKRYLSAISNLMEIVLIALSIMIITMDFESPDAKILTVVTLLLMATELCWLVGYLPILSISTHMLMLEEVLKTFLKSFSFYSIFVLTFVLCFYVLFGTVHREDREKEAKIANNITNPNNCTAVPDADYKFEDVFKSIPKTMAMLVGELDFESLNFQNAFGYILFFLFVICMTVVLMNLLNGLAVSDIQTIRHQAELNELICRAKLLNSHCKNVFSIEEDCFSKCYLTVQPNFKGSPNKVKFPGTCPCTKCKQKEQKEEVQEIKNNFWSWFLNEKNMRHVMDALRGKCTSMGPSIVKSADKIMLHKENPGLNIEEKVKSIETKLAKLTSIEATVNNILENRTIEEKVKSIEDKLVNLISIEATVNKILENRTMEEKVKSIEDQLSNVISIEDTVNKILENLTIKNFK